MSENVNVDLLKHQLCRAFRNLRVANEVVIQRDGEHGGLKIIPKYADVKVVDAEEISPDCLPAVCTRQILIPPKTRRFWLRYRKM